jgi:hypothetical protein
MIVMPANNSSGLVHYLAGKYPGKLGWLIAPGDWIEPRAWLPYAIDNGRYSAWENDSDWDEEAFYHLLDRCQLCRFKPMWVAVPDEVANREKTLWLWNQYERSVGQYKFKLAFVVQDGMKPSDVPKSADVIFVGGTTEWKWRNVGLFCATFPRVHVGRVNWVDKLEYCERIGAESCDGTGFFRGGPDSVQAKQLRDFIAGERRSEKQPMLI